MRRARGCWANGVSARPFDGVCVMCDGIVTWLLSEDERGQIVVCTSADPRAAALLGRGGGLASLHFEEEKGQSILVMDPAGNVFMGSDAAVAVLRALGGRYWGLARMLALVPKGIRDRVYDFVGQRRYAIFGKKEYCGLPSAARRAQFL